MLHHLMIQDLKATEPMSVVTCVFVLLALAHLFRVQFLTLHFASYNNCTVSFLENALTLFPTPFGKTITFFVKI